MKTKLLLLGLVVLLAAGGAWFGRAAWRAHEQLVTLDVRDMPLPAVLHKVEWQTWEKIRAEQSLDRTRITLRVKNKPLSFVLDRIAGQAGAHWSKIYAVYSSGSALDSLDAALRSDGKLGAAGWTLVAPKMPDLEPSVRSPGGSHPQHMTMMRAMRTPNGTVFFGTGPNGQTQEWSQTELIAESPLLSRLTAESSEPTTAASAAAVAQKVDGHWTTYFALSKSIAGIGFAGMPPRMAHFGQGRMRRGANGGLTRVRRANNDFTNSTPEQSNIHFPSPPAINPNERFANLTPQERVQQARMRQEFRNFRSSNHIQSPFHR